MFKSVLAGPIIYGNLSGKELKKKQTTIAHKVFWGGSSEGYRDILLITTQLYMGQFECQS